MIVRGLNIKIGVAVGLLFCVAISTLCGQTPTATLVGTVIDPTGSAVVGAKVEVRNSGTNEVRKAECDQKGEFTMPNLAPGMYDVSVSKDGFRTLREAGLELELDQQARMEYHLQLGSLVETVEVTASVPLVNTENGSKGDVMVSQEMVEMPLNGRSFGDLAFLMPTVVPPTAAGTGQGWTSAWGANGQRSDNTNLVIDGLNNRNPRDGAQAAQPNLDAMQEFKVQTTGYSAEAGRTAGGLITMVLKSGTNQLHGTLFEFLRNDKLDARNFFATSNPELRRNQFGGLVSGPVVIPKLYNGRNRTFFLFSWESYRQVQASPTLLVMPTAPMKQGDFSAFAPIKDPLATGTCSATNRTACFPGNQIPLSRMSASALAMQAFYPLPNYPGVNNFYSAGSAPNNWDSDVIKIDEVLTSRDSLSFKYLKRYQRVKNLGTKVPGFAQQELTHPTMTGLTYTRMFSPSLINEARFGLARTAMQSSVLNLEANYGQLFGMSGGPADFNLTGFPQVNITGYATLGPSNAWPMGYWENSYDTSDTVTWVKGAHLIKFGGAMLRSQFDVLYDTNARGTYNFTGSWTTNAYADFLLGTPNSDTVLNRTLKTYLVSHNYSAFFEDAWKITSRLTLDLGLRYELPLPVYDKYGRMASFIPELNKLAIASDATLRGTGIGFTNSTAVGTAQQLGLPFSLVYPDYRDFAPRLGFAWRPFGGNRTVLRGGYGIFYGTWELNNISGDLVATFPFAVTVTNNSNASNPNYLTLANPFPVAPTLTQNVVSANGFQLHAPTPYTQSWNLTVEREIGNKSALEAGYMGAKGTHLGRYYNIDQPKRSAATYPNFPYPYPGWSTVNYFSFETNSIYNAASFTFRRRFVNSFFYRTTYVYAKSIDGASRNQGSDTPQDPLNLRLERGRSDFDIGHTFTMAFSWQAPRRYNILLRGWQLAGTGIVRTGAPITLTVNNVNLNLGQASRPNRILEGTVPNPSPQEWYNVSAFPQVPSGAYTFGTSGRNILDAPGVIQMNLSFSRNFAVRERSKLQFRWEVFNLLNHANFNAPVTTVNTANAATITAAADGRTMQVALRYSF